MPSDNPLQSAYNHFKTLVKQFCYDKTEISTLLGGKSDSNHTHGGINNGGTITESSQSTYDSTTDMIVITTGNTGAVHRRSTIPTTVSTDSNAHTNLNTSANSTQSAINTAIDGKIGDLETSIGAAISYINQ